MFAWIVHSCRCWEIAFSSKGVKEKNEKEKWELNGKIMKNNHLNL